MATPGTIFLIPTPISEGNINDVMLSSTRSIIQNLDYFIVENVRTARRLVSSLNPILEMERIEFGLFDKRGSFADVERLLDPVIKGRNVGIMSEAGCPGIADPGQKIMAYAHKKNVKIKPLIGPSSIILSLMSSGLNGQCFKFQGYLPIQSLERSRFIQNLEKESKRHDQTQIFMETPYRNDKMFDAVVSVCQQDTLLTVARDITGKDELIVTKPIHSWKKSKPVLNKIPCLFLLYAGK